MEKGKLFVIDGTDGSGKQTQLQKLKERFDKEGIEYRTVSFPNYDSPSSSLVKMYLAGDFGTDAQSISPYIASTFMQQIDMQLLKLVMKSIIIMVELFWRIDTQQLIWFTKQEK